LIDSAVYFCRQLVRTSASDCLEDRLRNGVMCQVVR